MSQCVPKVRCGCRRCSGIVFDVGCSWSWIARPFLGVFAIVIVIIIVILVLVLFVVGVGSDILARIVALGVIAIAIDIVIAIAVVIVGIIAVGLCRGIRRHLDDAIRVFGSIHVLNKMRHNVVDAIGIVVESTRLLDRT